MSAKSFGNYLWTRSIPDKSSQILRTSRMLADARQEPSPLLRSSKNLPTVLLGLTSILPVQRGETKPNPIDQKGQQASPCARLSILLTGLLDPQNPISWG